MPPPAPTFWKKVDENQVCYFIWPNALLCSIRHTISCPYQGRSQDLQKGGAEYLKGARAKRAKKFLG